MRRNFREEVSVMLVIRGNQIEPLVETETLYLTIEVFIGARHVVLFTKSYLSRGVLDNTELVLLIRLVAPFRQKIGTDVGIATLMLAQELGNNTYPETREKNQPDFILPSLGYIPTLETPGEADVCLSYLVQGPDPMEELMEDPIVLIETGVFATEI